MPSNVSRLARLASISIAAVLLHAGAASAQSGDDPRSVAEGTGERTLPHLRFGLELGGGVGYGASTAAVLGTFGHVGYQLNRTVAFFYQAGLASYGFTEGDEVRAFGVFSNAAMVDLTLGDVAQLGAGGGFDYGDFAHCPEDEPCTYDGAGISPKLALRVGFLLRVRRARARWYVPFMLHAHIAFAGDNSSDRQNRQTMLLLSLGLERAGMRLRR